MSNWKVTLKDPGVGTNRRKTQERSDVNQIIPVVYKRLSRITKINKPDLLVFDSNFTKVGVRCTKINLAGLSQEWR